MSPLKAPPLWTEPQLLYPPRPGGEINPATLSRYRGFLAQYKFNDIRAILYLLPGGELRLYDRQKNPLRIYKPEPSFIRSARSLDLDPDRIQVLDGGLLFARAPRAASAKSPAVKMVLWDLLVHDSEYLLGSTYLERYDRLFNACLKPVHREQATGHSLAWAVAQHFWLAENFRENLEEQYRKLIHLDEIEGLVLKNPGGRLERGLRPENNGQWQIRVRKPREDYVF